MEGTNRFASQTVIILEGDRPEELSDGRDIIQVSHRPSLKPRLPPTLLINSSTSLAWVHTQSGEDEMEIPDF